MNKFANLMEEHIDEICALEALDTGMLTRPNPCRDRRVISLTAGKNFAIIKQYDFQVSLQSIRYFAGWADKHCGKTMEVGLVVLYSIVQDSHRQI